MKVNKNNLRWHKGYVTRQHRNRLNTHKSGLIWFTGLSASGKTTLLKILSRVTEPNKRRDKDQRQSRKPPRSRHRLSF